MKKYEEVPYFKGIDDRRNILSKDDLKGNYTILIFYPKHLPGEYSEEVLQISQQHIKYNKISGIEGFDVNLIIVTPDTEEYLAGLRNENDLDITFISDKNLEISNLFNVIERDSVQRKAYILDRWVRLRDVCEDTNPIFVDKLYEKIENIVFDDFSIDNNIEFRRAKRSFSIKKVSDLEIKKIIEAATKAPSCFNNQPWRYHVINSDEKLKKSFEYIPDGNYWMKYSSALIAVYSKKEDDCALNDSRDYFLFDTGMSVANLLLQATKMGIIAHPVAGYKSEKLKKFLNIDDESVLITVIAVGYPGAGEYLTEKHVEVENGPRIRKELDDILKWN